jgi:hypothetical protein
MRAFKLIAIALVVWAIVVAAFESMIGYMQPASGSTLLITTFDADGKPHDRVVSRLESGGKLYVAANHWPRAWYRRALRNPEVQASLDGVVRDYRAAEVSKEEAARVAGEHPLGPVFRVLTGFPPREFLRLDPRA